MHQRMGLTGLRMSLSRMRMGLSRVRMSLAAVRMGPAPPASLPASALVPRWSKGCQVLMATVTNDESLPRRRAPGGKVTANPYGDDDQRGASLGSPPPGDDD